MTPTNEQRLPKCHWLKMTPGRPEQMHRCFLCVTDECPFQDHLPSKTILLSEWTMSPGRPEWMWRGLPCATDECPFQNHLLSKTIKSIGWAPSPGRPEQMCRHFPVLLLNTLSKTIFQVKLSYQLYGLCLLGMLNRCAEASLYQWWISFTRPSSE